jgi:small-conductance mechanosensitive channel
MSTSPYPVRLVGGDDLGRSRLTVFFRIFLLIPHMIVLWFYAIIAIIAVVIAWFAALFTGRVPDGLHNFIAGYLRYYLRVVAYATILADPFPPFGGGGTYPVDVEIDPPVPQGRLGVFFRILLAIPCLIVANVLQYLLYLVAIGCWFVALFTGGVPEGLQTLGMFCLRFIIRTHAYVLLVNPRYPAFGDTPGSLPAEQAALPPLP